MCEACGSAETLSIKPRRRRIWEIDHGWHCSIVGTCLSLGDLRTLARKLSYRGLDKKNVDYFLHGHFVKEASGNSKATKLLNKLLDRKHASVIRRFQKVADRDGLAAAWAEAFRKGDVPGPYWAVLSHPLIDFDLGSRVYSDVHMLSHLVGASNRADMASLNRMELEIAELQERVEKGAVRYRDKLAEKDREVEVLHEQIALLRRDLDSANIELSIRNAQPVHVLTLETPPKEDAGREARALAERLEQAESRVIELQQKNQNLTTLLPRLTAELHGLEQALAARDAGAANDECPFNLDGRCILYVGGRTQNVCRLRELVSRWNGELLHHDGGMERSIDELSRAIVKADAVVFPTDCVSHQAMHKVKRLCRQRMKPYVPLRSSGVASFIAGLREEGFVPDRTIEPGTH